MTTSISVDIRIHNYELTFNDLHFIEDWSSSESRVVFCLSAWRAKIRNESLLYLSVCVLFGGIEISDKLLRGVPRVHVEG